MLPGQHQEVKMWSAQAEWSQAVDFGVGDLKPQTRVATAPPGRHPPGS